ILSLQSSCSKNGFNRQKDARDALKETLLYRQIIKTSAVIKTVMIWLIRNLAAPPEMDQVRIRGSILQLLHFPRSPLNKS
ncbi:MAG: hypothetical protein Q8P64_05760, partial [Deltaproteobacteria bacterium]|nr:hypothetical protein [Deltaproteobacteria bacterium]